MEVRARGAGSIEDNVPLHTNDYHKQDKGHHRSQANGRGDNNPGLCSKITRECREMGRVTMRMLKGQGSALSYLFIPAFISMLWIILCLLTVKSPSLTLEERLNQKYLRVSRVGH